MTDWCPFDKMTNGLPTQIECISKRRVAAFFFGLLLFWTLFPRPAVASGSDPQKIRLNNGMVLVTKQNSSSNIVAIDVFVRAGSRYDPRGKSGLANIVSGLLLNSYSDATGKETLPALDETGGAIQVVCQQDYIEIYYATTAANIEPALHLILDLLKNARFENDRLEMQKKDSLQEIETSQKNWFPSLYSSLMDHLYEVSPYRRPIGGESNQIKRISITDVQAFYGAYFVPNNIVVSVVGDVSSDSLTKSLNEMSADFLSKPVPRIASPVDETVTKSNNDVIQQEGKLTYVMVGYLAPALGSTDYPAAMVLNSMIGGGKASRLFQSFREEEGIGYELGTLFPPLQLQSHFIGYVATDPYRINLKNMQVQSVVNSTKEQIAAQYQSIRDGKFSESELHRAKQFIIGSYALQHQRMKDQAFFLGWYEAMGPGYQYDMQLPDKFESVTREDIKRVAATYLNQYGVVALIPSH